MKNKLLILTLVGTSFLTGVSFADSPPPEKKKASVSTSIADNKINIVITPDQGYKWNGQNTPILKFSESSDIQCLKYLSHIHI